MRLRGKGLARVTATLALGALLAAVACPAAARAGEGAAPMSSASFQRASVEQQVASWQASGTCEWRIVDGRLEVRPTEGRETGSLGTFDWRRYCYLIRSAVILPGVDGNHLRGHVRGL